MVVLLVWPTGHHHASGHGSSRRRMIERILLQRVLSTSGLELGHRRSHGMLMELGLDPEIVAEDLCDGELEIARLGRGAR